MKEKIRDLEKLYDSRKDELCILKAKLHLDLISVDFKIIPEFPDLVEENFALEKKIEILEEEIKDYSDRLEIVDSSLKDC